MCRQNVLVLIIFSFAPRLHYLKVTISTVSTIALKYLEFACEALDERNESTRDHEAETRHEIVLRCQHEHAASGKETPSYIRYSTVVDSYFLLLQYYTRSNIVKKLEFYSYYRLVS